MPNKKSKAPTATVTVKKGTETTNISSDVSDFVHGARQRKSSVKILESSTVDEDASAKTAENVDNSTSDLQNVVEDSASEYSEETETPSEGDNDSDLDYNLSQGNTIPKVTKKKRKKKRKNAAKTIRESKKRKSDDGDPESMVAELDGKKAVKKVIPSRKMAGGSRRIPSRGKQIPEGKKTEQETSTERESTNALKTSTHKSVLIKKEKKSLPHMDALLSDMSSLFSKPDKIKKIEPPKVVTSSTSKGFVSLTSKLKLPETISVQTHSSATDTATEQLDLIDSIVKEDLECTNEGRNDLNEGGNNQEVDLPDNALLETLGEALPEDFLQHVAELAENKDLQEIIDKQVLGVNDTDTSIQLTPVTVVSNLITHTPPINSTQKATGRQVMRSDGRVITLPPIETPTTRAKRRAQNTNDSLTIQGATPAKIVSKVTPQVIVVKEVDVVIGDQSRESSREKSTSRRSSIAETRRDSNTSSSKKSDGRKRKTNPAVLAVLNDDDDLESDESWNSEDDPDR